MRRVLTADQSEASVLWAPQCVFFFSSGLRSGYLGYATRAKVCITEKHSAHQRAYRYDVFMMAKAEENSEARCGQNGSLHAWFVSPYPAHASYVLRFGRGLLGAWERWLQCLLACWRFGIADHQRIQTKRFILSLYERFRPCWWPTDAARISCR
jgi:hypothetical protein